MAGLALAAESLLDEAPARVRVLSGGDLSQVLALEMVDGRQLVAKNGPAPRVEADMLRALAVTGIPVPRVVAANDDALLMEWVDGHDPVSGCWPDLGTQLRRLHGHPQPQGRYGWSQAFGFGALAIDNAWHGDWPAFWAERRLAPFLSQLPPPLARRVASLAADLHNRLPATPRASLLHGDLWTGNVMARGDRVAALIDPACYLGDGEVDVAMLQLFGAPGDAFFDQYGTLAAGAPPRLAIYRLWPALVHLRLFGSGYRARVEEQLRSAGA